ncbi:MAG TPA: SdpI family protein [Chloroflexota bacterium]|nr:SdpI family protein [Chloroflexota bacterium]
MPIRSVIGLFLCVLFIALGMPLVLGWVQQNHLYGLRTRATYSSSEVWRRANVVAGKLIVLAGILALVVDLIVWFSLRQDRVAQEVIMLILPEVLVLVAAVISVVYSNRLARQ